MYCRSITSLICMFMAVSLATLNRDPDSTKEWSMTESVREVRKDVGEELGPLLDDGDDAVVRLEAGGTHLVAHRAVLAARSPVLESMLRHYSVQAGGGRLSVPGVEGPVLRHLVAYLYTLRAPRLSPGTATQLLAAAHNLGLPALQADCERQVAAQLSVKTAASAAVLAVKYSADHLRDAAVDFIKEHRIKVLATKGWADALENQPKEAAEVSHLLADRLAGICAPATAEAGTPASTQPHSGPGQAAATAAPQHAACPTTPLDEATVSSLRNLSGEVRDSRLIEAARKGAVGELRALLAAGADVRAKEDDGTTALHMAVGMGYVEAASCLLGGGAEVDARNRGQRTPLYAAAHWNRAAVARLLLAASADPNVRDEAEETPLHWTAKRGSAEVAAALLQAGADRGARDYKGQTPLDHARINDQQQLIEILTQH